MIIGDKIAKARSVSLVAVEFVSLEYVELYIHAICRHLYRDFYGQDLSSRNFAVLNYLMAIIFNYCSLGLFDGVFIRSV